MRLAFRTFGCKANATDTDALHLEAIRRGHVVVGEKDPADALVINTCTVTAAADKEARQELLRYKRKNPDTLIGVLGCYAQVAKEELLALPEVDVVMGTAEKVKIIDSLEQCHSGHEIQRDQVINPTGFLLENFPGSRLARAPIKIQDGCNFKCSFCIIPRARGRSRSLPIETVLKQIDQAEEQGFEEVVLTGIHIAHYGWDQNTDLLKLLKAIFKKTTGPRIRLSTLDPFELPDELISWLGKDGKEPRLCPHFHIALQSGSDRILKGMRRIYAAHEFYEVNEKIRKQNPRTFIGVDVIVGFPGETEEDFEQTVQLLEKSFWAKLHVFPYSERKETGAADLPNKIDTATIAVRSERLRKMSDERLKAFTQKATGQKFEVVLEKISSKHPNHWLGHTENYLPVLMQTSIGKAKGRIPFLATHQLGERLVGV